jgi:hypothetical protein
MVETDQSVAIQLPEDLRGQFERLERRLFRVETGVLVAGTMAGLAGAYLLVFASDRIWDSPVWLRTTAFAGGVAVIAWCGSRWLKRWIFKRRTRKDLAAIVQRRFQRLGDRLLGIVELSSEEKHLHGFSPELYRAAIRQVAAESVQYDFTEAVPLSGFERASRLALVGAGIALVTFFVFPRAGLNATARAAAPWASIPRFTLVEIADLPSELLVPHGEEFKIVGAVRYLSFWKPSHVGAWFGRMHSGDANVNGDAFNLSLAGRTENGVLRVKVGDAETRVQVRPLLRPSLKNLEAAVELPDYLKLPPRTENAQGGTLTVVEGSKASFHGKVSRPLKTAEAFIGPEEKLPVKTQIDQFTTAAVPVDNVQAAEFRWQDEFGFTNQSPWKLSIQTQKDAGPVPEIPDLSREMSILESEVVQIKVRARDDFGVQKVGLIWDLGAATNQPYDFSATAKDTAQAEFEGAFTFTPLVLQVEQDSTIAVRGFATDFFPGREPIETPSYRIHVLGNEQHAEMVRQRLEAVMARLEEVSRLEEKIAAATGELKDKPGLSDEELARKAAELKEDQLQNAAALKEMSEEGMKNLREALKNPTLSENVLKEWTKTMREMQDIASKPMQKAAQSLDQAGKQPKGKEKDLAEAQETERDVLQDLEQMQKRVNKGLDDMQALSLAQRLRKMGSGQKEIHTEISKVVGETIGMTPDELLPRHQKQNTFLAEQQVDAREKSRELQGEISRFFERTRKPNYGQVSKEMAEARTPEEMDRVRTMIESNVSMQAMDALMLWSDRFDAWADLLEPKKLDAGSSGQSGAAGEPPEEDTALKHLMALLRLREGQVNLRERTRMLDKNHGDEPIYKENAGKLREAESKLIESLGVVQLENDDNELEPVLRDSSRSMQSVEALLAKPQTDERTVTAHNKALQNLTDAINLLNEKAQKQNNSGQSSQQGEEMAFLMQMMQQQNPKPGMQGGMTPGMNFNGGTTDMPANAQNGNATGKADAARTARKAGGSTANLPAEFRDALENYYKAIEKGGL